MQSRPFFTLCCCFFFLPIFSQTHIGFKAGINYSKTHLIFNLQATDRVKRINHPSLHVSIPIEIAINHLLSLQPEIAYTSEGSTFSVSRPEEERIYNNLLHYIKLSVIAKILLIKTNSYNISLLGGVTPAYAIGIKSTSFPQYFGVVRYEPASFAIMNASRFDFALNIGASIEKNIAKEIKMILATRYNLGILDIDTTEERTSFTEGFYLSLGLLIPLKQIFK